MRCMQGYKIKNVIVGCPNSCEINLPNQAFIYLYQRYFSEKIIIKLNSDGSQKLSGSEDEIRRKHSRRSTGQ